jgi:sulfur carrier protein
MKIYVNGKPRQVDQTSPLLSVLDVPSGASAPRGVAVALDGAVVPRAQLGETVLHEGARVEIVTAVQGG